MHSSQRTDVVLRQQHGTTVLVDEVVCQGTNMLCGGGNWQAGMRGQNAAGVPVGGSQR